MLNVICASIKNHYKILTYNAYVESIHRMLTLNAYASIHFLPSIKKHDLSASILLSLWVAISLIFVGFQPRSALEYNHHKILTYNAYKESIHRMFTWNAYTNIHFWPSIKKTRFVSFDPFYLFGLQ